MHRQSHHTLRALRRLFLLPLWRALTLVSLVPALVIGPFGGTSFFAHAHHGHGLHWHAAPSPIAATTLAARHFTQHEAGRIDHSCPNHDHSVEADCGSSAQTREVPFRTPDGLLITIPDHDQLSGRVVKLPAELLASCPGVTLTSVFSAADDAFVAAIPDPPASSAPDPATSVLDRIVRTSHALLI